MKQDHVAIVGGGFSGTLLAVDELRPYTQGIWGAMDVAERRRFLRHLRPWWDIHRHRLAPAVAAKIAAMRADGRLTVVAGKVTDAEADGAHDTRRFARDIGLIPRTTPVESPQSNGMAEAFVRTLKRDYARVSPRPDARAVIDQLPVWLDHYNRVHPHRALGYRSPREFIDRSTREELSGL